MNTEEKVARRKLSLLELASDLNNMTKACSDRSRRINGYRLRESGIARS